MEIISSYGGGSAEYGGIIGYLSSNSESDATNN